MPIRFRCPHCTRLLGIARRKAGSQINCPQCARPVTVPVQEDTGELDELEVLLTPAAPPAPAPEVPGPEPGEPAVATDRNRSPVPQPGGPAVAAKPSVPRQAPRPQPRREPTGDDPLFEQEDVDAILGVKKTKALDLDEEPDTGPKPVSGLDAMSLEDGPGKIVLSSQKATLLVVAVVVLLGIAFAAGFLIASHL
ncbi:MAG: hypothetical protein JWO38_5035 [Gemmataceae bacterium]|nr:hypothetical protein [Gemmataceae bacterium]